VTTLEARCGWSPMYLHQKHDWVGMLRYLIDVIGFECLRSKTSELVGHVV